MKRLRLKDCDIMYDVSRLLRKRTHAHLCNDRSEVDNSDVVRFKKQLRKTDLVDEDYTQYLNILYNSDKHSRSCTNKGQHQDLIVVSNRPNHDIDADKDVDHGEDVVSDGPNHDKDADEDGCHGEDVVRDRSNHDKDADEDNDHGEDVVSDRPNNEKVADVEDDHGEDDEGDDHSEDDDEEDDEGDQEYLKFLSNVEPDGISYVLKIDKTEGFPSFLRYENKKDLGNDKSKNGACEGDDKVETTNGSNKEKKKRGRKRKSVTKEDVVEDEPFDISDFLLKKWYLEPKVSFKSKVKKGQPSDPLSPKIKRKRGRPRKSDSIKGTDASKGTKKRRSSKKAKRSSSKEQATQKRRKLAKGEVTVEEEVPGRELGTVEVKEEVPDVEVSGHHMECQFAEEILQILDKPGSSNLTEASSAIHYENVEDDGPVETMHSDFFWKVKAILEKEYDVKEYGRLLKAVQKRTHVERNLDLRSGAKSYSTKKLGKSYLDHYKDLDEKLKEAGEDRGKKLSILRGFFYWLENLTQEGAFKPWTNPECLSMTAKSS